MSLRAYLHSIFRRNILCRLGIHNHEIIGIPRNFCEWGCGRVFNKNAFKKWIVTLNSGEQFEVEAINEYHAESMVVYGGGNHKIDGYTGHVLAPVRIHRYNIMSAVLKP